jgi:chitodextrinase
MRGFSLIEAVMSVLIVGGLFITAMNTLTASKTTELSVCERACGQQLALDMMGEILQQAYQDPVNPPVFGPEPGKSTSSRSLYTDVDDYKGWSESPPQDKNGTPLAGFDGWSRNVVVDWADPSTLNATSTSNTGIKRITVTVQHMGRQVAGVAAFRTIAWVDTIPSPTDATGNHPPVAVMTCDNLTGRVSLNVYFDSTGSTDPDGDTVSYVWDFGDGAKGSGAKTSHQYTAVGSYTATLMVYDGGGGLGTCSVTISVTP